jgi:hypothetical protein
MNRHHPHGDGKGQVVGFQLRVEKSIPAEIGQVGNSRCHLSRTSLSGAGGAQVEKTNTAPPVALYTG